MSSSPSRVGALVLLAGLALAAAGCSSVAPSPTNTPSARTSITPSPAATDSKPALSGLVATPDGLGYLSPGAAVPTVPAATAILTFDPTKCVAPAEGVTASSPGAGAWLPSYPHSLTYAGSGVPFDVGAVKTMTDAISEIEIWSPDIKTAKHVGVGSTAAQLTAAYGSALTVDRSAISDVYVLAGARAELLFEVAKSGAGLPVEETGTVVWMRIVPLGTADLHIADTDVAGPCAF